MNCYRNLQWKSEWAEIPKSVIFSNENSPWPVLSQYSDLFKPHISMIFTNRPTDWRTNTPSYRNALPHLELSMITLNTLTLAARGSHYRVHRCLTTAELRQSCREQSIAARETISAASGRSGGNLFSFFFFAPTLLDWELEFDDLNTDPFFPATFPVVALA